MTGAEVIRAIDDLSAYYADVHEHLESCSSQRFGGILLRSPRKRIPRRRSSAGVGRAGRASGELARAGVWQIANTSTLDMRTNAAGRDACGDR
jgi:hypothetical protein